MLLKIQWIREIGSLLEIEVGGRSHRGMTRSVLTSRMVCCRALGRPRWKLAAIEHQIMVSLEALLIKPKGRKAEYSLPAFPDLKLRPKVLSQGLRQVVTEMSWLKAISSLRDPEGLRNHLLQIPERRDKLR